MKKLWKNVGLQHLKWWGADEHKENLVKRDNEINTMQKP